MRPPSATRDTYPPSARPPLSGPPPARDLPATAASSSATPANSRSWLHSPSRPPGPPAVLAHPRQQPARFFPTYPGGTSAPPATRRPPARPSSPSAALTGSSGSVPASGKHSPRTITIPAAAARAIASATNRVLPTPASPTTSTSRASPPSAPSSRDNSPSRPTKPAGPAMFTAHQPAPARSTPPCEELWRTGPVRRGGLGALPRGAGVCAAVRVGTVGAGCP